jgi:hypothetical protein
MMDDEEEASKRNKLRGRKEEREREKRSKKEMRTYREEVRGHDMAT